MGNFLKGHRTYVAGFALVVSSLAAYATGEQTAMEAAQAALMGVMGIFLRSAVKA